MRETKESIQKTSEYTPWKKEKQKSQKIIYFYNTIYLVCLYVLQIICYTEEPLPHI